MASNILRSRCARGRKKEVSDERTDSDCNHDPAVVRHEQEPTLVSCVGAMHAIPLLVIPCVGKKKGEAEGGILSGLGRLT
jgi:hypothetical protein